MHGASAAPIPILAGLSAVADRYDGFILDLWGVLHDGARPYPGAVETLRQLKRQGKRAIILSNGPRRATALARRTGEIGITPDLYDALHSSGEETWRLLRDRPDPAIAALGRRVFPIAPERDRDLLDGLDLEIVESPVAAEFLLVTGLAHAAETVADYEQALSAGARHGRPMLCANPDLEVVRAGVREFCAGALAARYEALGASVRYVGKPHSGVYRTCLAHFDAVARSRILAVGDSLRTDVAGATGVGVDSLLVLGGIHAEELVEADGSRPDPAKLATACAKARQWPTYAVPAFTW
jgi:HAD superfamily hydrolase (TIGR01459 family)